jgi:hypothetical protein
LRSYRQVHQRWIVTCDGTIQVAEGVVQIADFTVQRS